MLPIAPEGWRVFAPLFLVAVVTLLLGVFLGKTLVVSLGIFGLILATGLLLFFRDPKRYPPQNSDVVVAPADGRVLSAESLPDGRKRVAIFLSVLNVHVNRIPIAGKILSVADKPGAYFVANSHEAEQNNARVDVESQSDFGLISWRQVSGRIARKIACHLKEGDVVRTGERFGLIYFGSRMEVFLPACAELVVEQNTRTVAGETIIARMVAEKEQ